MKKIVFLFAYVVGTLSLIQFSNEVNAGVPSYIDNCWNVHGIPMCGDAETVGKQTIDLYNEQYEAHPENYTHLCGPTWYYEGIQESYFRITVYTYRTQTCVGPHNLYGQYLPWCPDGYEFGQKNIPDVGYRFVCKGEDNNPENQLGPSDCDEVSPYVGNPCNSATGNKYHREIDYKSEVNGSVQFARHYNSLASPNFNNRNNVSPIGRRWRHTYSREIIKIGSDINSYAVLRHTGKIYYFNEVDGVVSSAPDVKIKLIKTDNGYEILLEDDTREIYDDSGKLLYIIARGGITQTLSYDEAGILQEVNDDFGRTLLFNYDQELNLISLKDPDENVTEFSYSNGNLVKVTHPDLTTREYLYEDTRNTYLLTGIIDESGEQFASYSYDEKGRVIESLRAGDTKKVSLTYNDDTTTNVITSSGQNRQYSFTSQFGNKKVSDISGGLCKNCEAQIKSVTYDEAGLLATQTDFNDVTTAYTNNERGLQISRTDAVGTPQERTITTEWHSSFNLPVKIIEPTRTISYSYDSKGNLTKKVILDKKTGRMRATSYGYNEYGQIVTIDGPRTDVSDLTTYSYDTQGNISFVSNALGQLTQIVSHDASGRPLSIISPNGLTIELSYDQMGRLIERRVGSEITRYEYNKNGNLIKAISPDSTYVEYHYDLSHQIVALSDQLNNRVEFDIDSNGNIVAVTVNDSTGSIVRKHAAVFNELNQVIKSIGAVGQTTQYAYDGNGNIIKSVDPNGSSIQLNYDALNRLVSVSDALNGKSSYFYDSNGRVTRIVSPNNSKTTFEYDGLGNLIRMSSPDTGLTEYEYDDAGNLVLRIDANGNRTSYVYDELNRVTRVNHPDGRYYIYTYDSTQNSHGLLSTIETPDWKGGWEYDQHGRVTKYTQDIGGSVLSIQRQYDTAGRLSSVIYPSGVELLYTYEGGKISEIATNNETIINNITYDAAGNVTGWFWGNGLEHNRQYDLDSQLVGHSLAGDVRSLGYDAVGNLLLIADDQETNNYSYDMNNRLVGANNTVISQQYEYDTNSNRTMYSDLSGAVNYSYVSGSNRLYNIGGVEQYDYLYDQNGNILNDSEHSYSYNSENRIVSVDQGLATYTYNAVGQRIAKRVDDGNVIYFYSEDGRLIAEATPEGKIQKEYLYFNSIPVAVLIKKSSNPNLYKLAGSDYKSGSEVELALDVSTKRLEVTSPKELSDLVVELNGKEWKFQPSGKLHLNYRDKHRKIKLNGKFLIDKNTASGYILIKKDPIKVKYNLNKNESEGIYRGTSKNGQDVVVSIDRQTRYVTITRKNMDDISFKLDPHELKKHSNEIVSNYKADDFHIILNIASHKKSAYGMLVIHEGGKSKIKAELTGSIKEESGDPGLYYIHTDHINTPRVITDSRENISSPVWYWATYPFGENKPHEDPDGDGDSFRFNLRYPGQYYDVETGLHYNYYRYYNPRIGRYMTSDPIGLAGGLNTYVYARANPISYIDPLGLYDIYAIQTVSNPTDWNDVYPANIFVVEPKTGKLIAGPYPGSIAPDYPGQCNNGCPTVKQGTYPYAAQAGVNQFPNNPAPGQERYDAVWLGTLPTVYKNPNNNNLQQATGIWMHKGYFSAPYTKGCIAVNPYDWDEFISYVNQQPEGDVHIWH